MGQYYCVMNVDKKECFHPHDLGNGAKLMEWSYVGNEMTNALMNLLGDRWKGDRVYVVGDYANTTDDKTETWVSAYREAIEMFDIDEGYDDSNPEKITSLYQMHNDEFRDIHAEVNSDDTPYRYIVNTATGQLIDLEHVPLENGWYDAETDDGGALRIHPLPLLLAMGNGRGGGDYRRDSDHVGSWCATSASIRVREELEEFAPDFTMNASVVPYTEFARVMTSAKSDALYRMWQYFAFVKIDDDKIGESFLHFEKGTKQFDIWKWFDERYEGGVRALIRRELSDEKKKSA